MCLNLCRTGKFKNHFPYFFKRFIAACKFCPHDDGYRTRRYFFGHSGDDLARHIDRKAACRLVFGAVCYLKENSLCRIFFVYLDFLAFDDDVIAYCKSAVF